MNFSSASALALHLSGLYVRAEARPVRNTAWGWAKGAWVVRCLHPAGFWVVYTRALVQAA